jgi:hypothetical protein
MATMCSKELINGLVEYEEFEMLPQPMEKWMKRSIINEEEAEEINHLIESGLLDYLDHNAEWTRQEERLIAKQSGYGEITPEITHEKSDWPRINPDAHGLMVIDKVEGFYMSHLESSNPYYAGAYPMRSNPDREQLLHDNRVVRKHTDQVTRYMGQPTYAHELKDKCIYTDIYGHIDMLNVHIRITNDITNIECVMVHTDKGTVKLVNVDNGYICELEPDYIKQHKTIPLLHTTIKGMFDNKGNALPHKIEKEDMNIEGCITEISHLKEGDCLFDHTRQLQVKQKETNNNKYINMRIQSLRNRINKVVDNYKMGYISEEKATIAVNKYKTGIERLNAKRI